MPSLPGPPGAHFGPPGAHLGPPGDHFGPPGAHFGPPGAHFGLGRPSLWGASWGLQNRSRRLARRPPAPELDFRSILGVILASFWDPPELKKQGVRVASVAFFEKSWGSKEHPKNGNLINEEREAREKREPQASQATENTRREAQTTARRTRAKHHEAQPSQRGESNASIKIASVVGHVQPLLARCARSPGVWSWNVS